MKQPGYMTVVLFAAALFLAVCTAGVCEDYYIDATGGDDVNDGTSPVSAWRSLSKVNAGGFNAGDRMLFKRGEVWTGNIEFPNSGSAGAPITISAYGAGARPTIQGSVRFIGRAHLNVSELCVQDGGVMLSDASHHIVIENCEVTGESGIAIYGDFYNDFDAYVTVRNCHVHHVGGHGIGVAGEEQLHNPDGSVSVRVRKLRHVTIENCLVHDVSRTYSSVGDSAAYGIKLLFADECVIRNNEVYNCDASGINLDGNRGGPEGVYLPVEYQEGCDNNEIAYNDVHNNGTGINLEVSSSNLVHHNRVHANGTGGWYGGVNCLWRSANNIIYYNLIYDNDNTGAALGIGDEGSTGNQILNNVIIGNDRGITVGDAAAQGTVVKNNIVKANYYPFAVDNTASSPVVSDYNTWFGGRGIGGYPTITLEEWRSLTGNGIHSMFADPAFFPVHRCGYGRRAVEGHKRRPGPMRRQRRRHRQGRHWGLRVRGNRCAHDYCSG